MWLGISYNLGLLGLAIWDLLGTSKKNFSFTWETWSPSARQRLPNYLSALMVTDLIFSDMSQFANLVTRKGGTGVTEEFLLQVVTRWAMSMFLMISSLEKYCIFLAILFARTIFMLTHFFSDWRFLLSLKTSFASNPFTNYFLNFI